MSRLLALVALLGACGLLGGCPHSGRAQRAKVEIDWPDAAVIATPKPAPADAGPADAAHLEL